MSILTVQNLTHGFGDRAIFDKVSFRLLKGEHIGLIGANGEENRRSLILLQVNCNRMKVKLNGRKMVV